MPIKPYQGYKDKNGKTIPGTTTVGNRFEDKNAIMYWQHQQGAAGIPYNQSLKEAGLSGNCTHKMVECDIRGKTFDRSDYPKGILVKADHAFEAYLEWKFQTKLKVIKPELRLVSETLKYGGTLDAMLVQGKLCIGDWKTSGAIYPGHLVQVGGGYSLLWEEHFPDEPLHGLQIIRFSKPDHPDDPISFSHHFWGPEIFKICQRQFILFREAYDLDKRLKKLV